MSAWYPQLSYRNPTLRGLAVFLLVLSVEGSLPQPARAQSAGPTLNLMALSWIRGRYGEPLLCTVEGGSTDVMRPILISPGPRSAVPPVARIRFFGLESLQAARCTTELATEAKFDLEGLLYVHLDREVPVDMLEKEFRSLLKREQGFTFKIDSGRVELRRDPKPDGEKPPPEIIDFEGGSARFRLLGPNEDATRILKDFQNRRKMELEVTSREGRLLRFHIIHLQER